MANPTRFPAESTRSQVRQPATNVLLLRTRAAARYLGLGVRACLEGKNFLAGNWPQRELIERLEQVGVEVEVNNDQGCHRTFGNSTDGEKTAIDER